MFPRGRVVDSLGLFYKNTELRHFLGSAGPLDDSLGPVPKSSETSGSSGSGGLMHSFALLSPYG